MKEKKEEKKITTTVINLVTKTLKENSLPCPSNDIANAQFHGDLGFDSLKTVELFMECEEIFGISFKDEEIFKTDTVGKLIEKIKEKLPDSTR